MRLILCAMLALAGAPLFAQQSENDRIALHAETPIVYVGMNDGPDGFRTSTPLLTQSDKKPTIVDRAELERRTLAMYENGVPIATAVGGSDEATSNPRPAPPPEEARSAPNAWLLVAAAAIVGVIAFAFARARRAS